MRVFSSLLRAQKWAIGLYPHPIQALLREQLSAVTFVEPPECFEFLADPFGTNVDSEVVVFCEGFDRATKKGRIVTANLSNNPPKVEATSGLGRDNAHLSYPFVFRVEDELYCLPESASSGQLELYRCLNFPRRWESVRKILRGRYLDPTLFQYQGRWWLFCTDQDRGSQTSLVAWWSTSLAGPWLPHKANPIKVDVRSARPAGTPFIRDGVLFRPGQDSSRRYGARIALNRVDRLTEDVYSEVLVKYLFPDHSGPYPDGLHTISSVGKFTLVDGYRTVLSTRNLIRLFGRSSKQSR